MCPHYESIHAEMLRNAACRCRTSHTSQRTAQMNANTAVSHVVSRLRVLSGSAEWRTAQEMMVDAVAMGSASAWFVQAFLAIQVRRASRRKTWEDVQAQWTRCGGDLHACPPWLRRYATRLHLLYIQLRHMSRPRATPLTPDSAAPTPGEEAAGCHRSGGVPAGAFAPEGPTKICPNLAVHPW